MQRLAASVLSGADGKVQFEPPGYFVAHRVDHAAGKPVLNLAVGLRDGWGKYYVSKN